MRILMFLFGPKYSIFNIKILVKIFEEKYIFLISPIFVTLYMGTWYFRQFKLDFPKQEKMEKTPILDKTPIIVTYVTYVIRLNKNKKTKNLRLKKSQT